MPETSRETAENFYTPANVERYLKEFTQYIQDAEQELLVAYYSGDPEVYATQEKDVIIDLDERWPFHGHSFLVAGQWAIGNQAFDVNEDEAGEPAYIRLGVNREDVLRPAFSEGVNVNFVDDQPRVCFSFITHPIYVSAPGTRLSGVGTAIALPEEVSLSYMGDPSAPEDSSVDIVQSLEVGEALHKLYLSKTSTFFDLSRPRQRRVMDSLVHDVNSKLFDRVKPLEVDIHTGLLYVNNLKRSTFEAVEPEEDNEWLRVRGQLAGIGLMNQVAFDNRIIRTSHDLIDPNRGLYCDVTYLVEPTSARVAGETVTHVPYADIYKLVVEHGK